MSAPGGRRSDVVHTRLRADILEGRLTPGEPVASERALAEELEVNRHAVREALKRLEQAGLVRISQGGATRVLDWRQSAGLEVLLDLVNAPDGPPIALARAVLEMRESIGVDAARRCAERADDEARAAVDALAARAASAIEAAAAATATPAAAELAAAITADAGPGGHALVDPDEAYAALWRAVVAGAQNIAYQLALTSLVDALDAHPQVAELVRPRDAPGVRALGAAVAAGAVDEAERAARRLLEPDTRAFD